jgi:copper chaperone CopZ
MIRWSVVPAALLALTLAVAVPASAADTVTWIVPTPGVITDENGAAARGAVLAVKGVVSAEAFVTTHTVEVEVIDPSVPVDEAVRAIQAAGYTTGTPRKKGPDRK